MGKVNIFENPQFYRNVILQQKYLIKPQEENFKHKSLICVFFTCYCGTDCPFCFFKSPSPKMKENDIENKFNDEAIDKFIAFANQANVGYLQISGGGEPFLEKEAILKSIENIKADRIILVTSGNWAFNKENAEQYLDEIQKAIKKRQTFARISIRLSVSAGHSIMLKKHPLVNLIKIFDEKYKCHENFTLQLKTFDGDDTLFEYLKQYFNGYKIHELGKNQSDDEKMIKIMPWKYKITLPSGYVIVIGKTRFFEPTLLPNLYDEKSIQNTVEIYNEDLDQSQSDFPSIVFNSNGGKGLDWIIEYNGNVCTWQNRVQDNLLNIYEDNYDEVFDKTTKDLLTLSFIEKGSKYREKIISEVSPKTVTLMKAVNIRDYAGTLLFEDEKIRLYYNLRVLQDYIKESRINTEVLSTLPSELLESINLDKSQLKCLYNNSTFSVLAQEMAKEQSDIRFNDFLKLVNLGHYELSNDQIRRADEHIRLIEGIGQESESSIDRRLTSRVMTIKRLNRFIDNQSKKEKYIHLIRHGETDYNVKGIIKGQSKVAKTTFTEKGLEQILALSDLFLKNGIDRIYGSDMARTIETAIISNKKLNIPVSFHKEIRGFNMGIYQDRDMLISDFIKLPDVQMAFKDHSIQILGGESINELVGRFTEFIKNKATQTTHENIAIIAHGAAISNVHSRISGDPYRDIDYCKLRYFNNEIEVVCENLNRSKFRI
jgi:broad specificity phosphatase PhoE/uncharacterized Fe-S cluster-containing radical SAM superfamily protein